MKKDIHKGIVEKFIKVVENFRNSQIITNEDLKNHVRSNLHSWLQYALIQAGSEVGLLAVPEIKVRFSEPIDQKNYGLVNKKRKRHFSRVDVAFFDKNKNLTGISEVFTIDEAHGALTTKELAKVNHYWLTPRDSLIHLIQHSAVKPQFVILVTTLLRKASKIAWKIGIKEIDEKLESNRDYYDYYNAFKKYWVKFKDEIERKNVKVSLLILNENGIEKC